MYKRTAKQELQQASRERFAGLNRNSFDLLPIWRDHAFADTLEDLCDIVKQASRTTGPWFRIKTFHGQQMFEPSLQGRRLINMLPNCYQLIYSQADERHCDPSLEVLLQILTSRQLHLVPEPLATACLRNPHPWVDIMNGVITELRRCTNIQPFFNSKRHHQACLEERFRELKGYLQSVDRAYPCSSVVTLDLGYRDTRYAFDDFGRCEQRYELLRTHTQSWWNNIKQFFGSAVVGEASKFDFDGPGLYKMHAVLILNGPKPNELDGIISSCADEWRTITGNHGYFFDCACDDAQFEYRGINKLDQLTSTVSDQLHRCAVFLAKTDRAIWLAFDGKPAPFGMGKLARPTQLKTKPTLKTKNSTLPFLGSEVNMVHLKTA